MNRNFEQRFRRRNNNNNHNNQNNNGNQGGGGGGGNSYNKNYNSNNRFNQRDNQRNGPRDGGQFRDGGQRDGGQRDGAQFRGGNNAGSWKTRDARNNIRRPMNVNNNRGPNTKWNSHRSAQSDGLPNGERWFKVTIPHAAKLEPFFAVNALQSQGIQFTPFNYTTNGNAVVFFVQGEELCGSIRGLSRRIATPQGMKLIITTEKSTLPLIEITDEFTAKLKLVMSNRYDVNSKFLNLANFATEEAFLAVHLYVSLQRINVCKEAVKIIIENIPDLRSINLSNNKIQSLMPFKPLVTSCKHLKQLDLSYNNINNIEHLENLAGMELETLSLDFNPFKKSLKDQTQENYVRLIRERFPKVINLDGISLPPPICFDVEEPTALPPSKPNCIPDQVKEFVDKFINEYFTLFDSDNRQALLDRYYEQANFSYTVHRCDSRARQKAFDMSMLSSSRNLLRIRTEQQERLLRTGRAQVVSALSNLPQTEHLRESFKVDVPVCLSSLIVININGLYKNKNMNHLKAFSRNFVIVALGPTQTLIVNDMLSITTPTAELLAFAKSLGKNDPNQMESVDEGMSESSSMGNPMNSQMSNQMSNQINNQINSLPLGMNPLAVPMNNNNQPNLMNNDLLNPMSSMNPLSAMNPSTSSLDPQAEIVRRFAAATGMNEPFSKQCLSENNFNAEKAMQVFKGLNELGKIPPEAFNR